jgi:hypothetical protein
MHGTHGEQQPLFSYVSREDRIAKHHPLRALRRLIDQILTHGVISRIDFPPAAY